MRKPACKKTLLVIASLAWLSGCADGDLFSNRLVSEAKVTDRTRAGELLAEIPAPTQKIAVSLYEFQDLTGQFKNNNAYTEYSSAVTKGGHAILTKALLDTGNHQWFTVTERGGLKNLLQERQIIDVMRKQYSAADGSKLAPLPPMIYSGLLIEGGIVSYDSNIITGGAGADYLGLSSTATYHRDMVTVYLRAINVQSGEVLTSVTSSKTIFSTELDNNILKYFTYSRLMQAEIGFSVNEPVQLAVRQAIETAVYSLVMEGVLDHIWDFKDKAAGQKALAEYLKRRDADSPIKPDHDDTDAAPPAPEQTQNAVDDKLPAQSNPASPATVPLASQPQVLTKQQAEYQIETAIWRAQHPQATAPNEAQSVAPATQSATPPENTVSH